MNAQIIKDCFTVSGSTTNIGWCTQTWNPMHGCTKLSEGCKNCYAEAIDRRFNSDFMFHLQPDKLRDPEGWKIHERVFVNSMSDVFHENCPTGYIDKVFNVMERVDRHCYIVLTKRSSIMRNYINDRYSNKLCPPHIWLGVSIENRKCLGRMQHLKDTNAVTRMLSLEPLLEDLGELNLDGISWVVVGGESGDGYRVCEKGWVKSIRNQAITQSVPFYFKQWSARRQKGNGCLLDDRRWKFYPYCYKYYWNYVRKSRILI